MVFLNNTWKFKTNENTTFLVIKNIGSTFDWRSKCSKNFTLSTEENDGFGTWKRNSLYSPFKHRIFPNGKTSVEVSQSIIWIWMNRIFSVVKVIKRAYFLWKASGLAQNKWKLNFKVVTALPSESLQRLQRSHNAYRCETKCVLTLSTFVKKEGRTFIDVTEPFEFEHFESTQ